MSGSFTQVFGGSVIYPSDVSYLALALDEDTTLAWPGNTSDSPVVASIIDVTPSGPYTITLDDALLASVGQTVLFNNLGPDTITVNKADGNAVLSIGPGEQWQIYLTDNSTTGGTWRSFRYGAATAQAQAAALAGAGLSANGSLLEQSSPVTEFSSTPYSATDPDRAKTLVWTGGLGTINLPAAATVGDGWFIQVRNGGQGDLTLDPSGSETINDASTLTLQPGDSAVVVCDGDEWFTIGYGQQPVFAFDYTSIAVTGGTYTLSGSELNRIAYKFTGVLGSNATIIVPATTQQYWVNNATTGAFTLGLRAAGSGTTTTVNQGETAILYCDGSSIISATTSSPFAGTLAISQGGTGATTAGAALTNFGATGIGSAVFTAATTAAGRTALAAAASGANSDITSLSGLTTPLSVAQGGTGSGVAATARSNLGAAASGANSDITSLSPAGGLFIGAATGGAQGAGTLNATGLFINGVAVGTGSGSVTSVAASGGTTGLSFTGSPISTSGTLTLGGTLGFANGGTGQTSYTNGQLLIGNTGTGGLSKATLTPGTGINITNGAGTITISSTTAGTVTSVDASGGSTGLTFSGGPVTGSGTLTLGGTLAVTSGGTGASSASGARLNLGLGTLATLSSVNNSNWSGTALTVPNGGTGQTAFSSGYVVKGNGSSALSSSIIYDTGSLIGISTTTPETTLDVNGSQIIRGDTNGFALFVPKYGTGAFGANYDRFEIKVDSATQVTTIGNTNGGTGAARALAFLSGGSERMRIDTSGNVGIGTSTPTVKLRVDYSDTNYVGGLLVANTANSGNAWGRIDIANTNTGGSLVLAQELNGQCNIINTTNNPLALSTNNTTRMTIAANGNVGIGTLSPSDKLDVSGAIRSSGTILSSDLATGLGVTTGDCAFEHGRDRTGNGNTYIDFHSTSGSDYEARIARYTGVNGGLDIVNTGTGNMLIGQIGAGALLFNTNSSTRMTVDNNGNVGIGTTSPGSKLDVSGTVTATAFSGPLTGNVTGTATNVSGTVAVANGGTGATNAATALTNLGAYPSSNPSGYTSNAGTVTSVGGTGSVNGLSLSGTVTSSGNITLGGSVSSVATGATIDGVTIGYRSIPRSTTSGTATTGDVGKCIAVSAGITIPNSTFAAGDAISIYNDSAGAITITAGVTTLRQAGTTNTGNRTLAARGMATIWFNSATEAVISGAGLS